MIENIKFDIEDRIFFYDKEKGNILNGNITSISVNKYGVRYNTETHKNIWHIEDYVSKTEEEVKHAILVSKINDVKKDIISKCKRLRELKHNKQSIEKDMLIIDIAQIK